MKILNHDTSKKTLIVAEIGNNHEGNFSLAEEMLGLAAEAGADAVKFQTCIPELFVSPQDTARMARMKQFQLSFNQFESLSILAKKLGVLFFSTPLDLESAKFLNSIQAVFKIASADNSFFKLIELISSFKKPTIISTGLGDIELLNKVRSIFLNHNKPEEEPEKLAFLHCVSAYPVPLEQVNLNAIHTLKSIFPKSTVGYSDHTLGIEVCVHAVAAGAKIIEKHFTKDKNLSDFRDHQLSADPKDLSGLVKQIRELESILGNGERVSQDCEEALRPALRRSIAAARDLEPGTILKEQDLIWIRPGTGIPCGEEQKVIDRKLMKALKKGDLLLPDIISG
jgi:N,N'-diacetyllegionaminate synthase